MSVNAHVVTLKNWLMPVSAVMSRQVALFIDKDSVSMAVSDTVGEQSTVQWCRQALFQSDLQLQRILTQWMVDANIGQEPCNLLLSPGSYRLVALEPPDVPPAEIRDAVFWGIKDLVDIPIDDLIVDSFAIPDHGAGQLRKLLYTVASSSSETQSLVNLCRNLGFNMQSVEILELHLPALLPLQQQILPYFAILYLGREVSSLVIGKNSDIYVARSMAIGFDNDSALHLEDLQQDAKLAEKLEQLVLEIQRSCDYFQSQLGQVAPKVLHIMPGRLANDCQQALAENLRMQCHELSIAQLDTADSVTTEQCQQALIAAIASIDSAPEVTDAATN